MANVSKILGQANPGATTPADLYTVPGATSAVVSSFTVCNLSSGAATFRLSASKAGAATSNKDYIYYDLTLAGNDTFIQTIGMTLAATDVVRVYGSTANLAFNLFGQEAS